MIYPICLTFNKYPHHVIYVLVCVSIHYLMFRYIDISGSRYIISPRILLARRYCSISFSVKCNSLVHVYRAHIRFMGL